VQQKKLKKSDYPLLGLIELARLEISELLNPERTQWLVNKLEGASNHLSKRILKYWSQNKHLEMMFDVRPARSGDPEGMTTGNNLWASVYDNKHKVTTLLGTRSRGFVWFFSFLAWFDQQQRKDEPLILLLDEPGLFLHGKAQEDLLVFIEQELKENHQVLYATHSPFLVDPRRFDRVRIVQDKGMDTDGLPIEEEGTKVLTDVLEATDDSLFPLQGALGYEIHQTLFVGPNCLVVEGVSDLLYLQTMSGVLERQGRTGLDHRWTITPVGGSEKVPTFVALLGAQKGLTIATLIDVQKKDKQTIENLYKKKLLKKKNVLTFADFTNGSEADIEDMFTATFYLSLVNSEYASQLKVKILETALQGNASRILVRLAEYLSDNPVLQGAGFNHHRPARYFAEQIESLRASIPEDVLQRFETAFKAVNNLL
jgi:energy-coupling factor transporter ATP-binding protein EcfA2